MDFFLSQQSVAFHACVEPFIDATFENASIVKIGETTKINANLKYANGTLKYKSNSDAIARVDENGVVTAVSEGYTVITIYLEGNENVKCRGIYY